MDVTAREQILARYRISEEIGFVTEAPLEFLPPYFGPWNTLAKQLPRLIADNGVRDKVLQLPLLDHTLLTSDRELTLAHLQLAFIASGYVWQNGDRNVPKVLPASIAVPWTAVSDRVGLPPSMSHADLILSNWAKVDPCGPMVAENLRCLYQLPGGEEAEWFIRISVELEACMGPIIKSILDGIACQGLQQESGLIQALNGVTESIPKLTESLAKLHAGFTAEGSLKFRPFLFGWGGKDSPLPEGLIFEGVSNSPQKRSIGGTSNATQPLDAFLEIALTKEGRQFMDTDLLRMPAAHKGFIEFVRKTSTVRQTAEKSTSVDLKAAYNRCVQALADFRKYHLQIVCKYLIIHGKREKGHKPHEAAFKIGSGHVPGPIQFLKILKDATLEALL